MKRRSPQRSEVAVGSAFLVTAAAAVGLAAVYWTGGQPQVEGVLLAIAFAGLATGGALFATRLVPQQRCIGCRHDEDEPTVRNSLEHDLERLTVVTRRSFLVRSAGLAFGALGVAALFPIRSLGPRPGRALLETPWKRGLRLVNADGAPVRLADVPAGGLVTVFPEGHVGSADGQAVLVRVGDESLIEPTDGRETWSPDGLIAYSKLCTHAGCPVGLYQPQTHELLCPCHQSAFDVLRAAKPVSGPAAAPLPQLPLAVDRDGYVIAAGGFSDPVGPSFWRRA